MLLLSNARLLDGTGGPAPNAAWLLIDGERIADIGWEGRGHQTHQTRVSSIWAGRRSCQG